MRLPGTLEERLAVLNRERYCTPGVEEIAALEDSGVRVECTLEGVPLCIQLRLEPNDIQLLRSGKCADFALLLDRGDGAFEAHVLELTKTVDESKWKTVQEQLEWATVRLLAIAGLLDIRLDAVVAYTAFRTDKLSRDDGSTRPTGTRLPLGPPAATPDEAIARRWAEARLAWGHPVIAMAVLGRDVEHVKIPADENGRAAVVCRPHPAPGDDHSRWRFEPQGA